MPLGEPSGGVEDQKDVKNIEKPMKIIEKSTKYMEEQHEYRKRKKRAPRREIP